MSLRFLHEINFWTCFLQFWKLYFGKFQLSKILKKIIANAKFRASKLVKMAGFELEHTIPKIDFTCKIKVIENY